MAIKKAKEHPSGVDRWTSNGHGIKVGKISDKERERGRKILESAKKSKGK